MKLLKRLLKIVLILLGLLALVVVVFAIYLKIKSPGTINPILDAKGKPLAESISEIAEFELGGMKQYCIIYGHSTNNPVMLYLHGGPGSPEWPFFRVVNRGVEKHVTVVHWEQRGGGKSFVPDLPAADLEVSDFVSDTIELSEKLCQKFGREKIILLGHSWGSLLGMLTIKERPDLYSAYIGIGQVAHLDRSEKIAYYWALEQASNRSDEKGISELNETGPPPYSRGGMAQKMVELKYVVKYGGGPMHDTSNLVSIMIGAMVNTREYTFSDKINYMRGNQYCLKMMWDKMLSIDLFEEVSRVRVPVYIMQGEYDYQVSTPLTKEYFKKLRAPWKKYYAFEKSAHGTLFEEPEKFERILVEEVLAD